MADTVVQDLIINTMSQKTFDAQKEAGTLDPNQLYLTPDSSTRMPVLTHMWFDHIANDVSWLRADTFSWQSGDVYKAAYEHLADDYESIEKDILYAWNWTMGDEIVYTKTSNPSVGDVLYNSNSEVLSYSIAEMNDGTMYINESSAGGRATRQPSSDIDLTIKTDTIGDITISYYLAEDGHKICMPDQESNISALYETTGVAWYYILDTGNKQFKLPRTKWGFVGVRDGVGGYVSESLPNITGTIRTFVKDDDVSGAFSFTKGTLAGQAGTGNFDGKLNFNASLSSNVYQDGAPVQQRATQMYLYFYVGNFEQDSVEQTAGINAEMFNGKADVNLMNTTSNVDFVVESQLPTAENNYTWYRKYKSGWVEQGGLFTPKSTSTGGGTIATITLPIEMSDNKYWWSARGVGSASSGAYLGIVRDSTTSSTSLVLKGWCIVAQESSWHVVGFAA